ncbi:MAG: phage tail protein [Bacteroides sp.]|nr:phage tail protein [Bacteroides sp.]
MNASTYDAFPPVLKNDGGFDGAARAIAPKLDENILLSERALVYSRIDSLPELALDILAYDFNIGWYEHSYGIAEKRAVIKEAFKIFRFIGTKYAVETALRSIYPVSFVREWFEYGGEPYHFIEIHDSANDRERCAKTIQKVKFTKNVRSVMDETVYIAASEIKTEVFCGAKTVGRSVKIHRKAVNYF